MVSSKQIAALKFLIFCSKDGNDLIKRVLAFLLDQSNGLTNEVCVTLTEDKEGFSATEIRVKIAGMAGMASANRNTHIDEVMAVTGTGFRFSIHYGHIDKNGEHNSLGQFPGYRDHPLQAPMRYTIWLSKKQYSKTATQLQVSREILESIDLQKPGLYPTLER